MCIAIAKIEFESFFIFQLYFYISIFIIRNYSIRIIVVRFMLRCSFEKKMLRFHRFNRTSFARMKIKRIFRRLTRPQGIISRSEGLLVDPSKLDTFLSVLRSKLNYLCYSFSTIPRDVSVCCEIDDKGKPVVFTTGKETGTKIGRKRKRTKSGTVSSL